MARRRTALEVFSHGGHGRTESLQAGGEGTTNLH